MKKIAILGSTGSIGTQTLEVVRENGDIEVLGLAAGSNIKMLEEQIREFHPQIVAVWSEEKADELRVNVAYRYKDCCRHGWTSGSCNDEGNRDPCNGCCRYDRYPSDN